MYTAGVYRYRKVNPPNIKFNKGNIESLGVAVVIEASHLCMMMRGVQKQNSVTTTSAFWGEFEQNETRSEFLKLISAKLH
jgi:GTP cyclohydrolase I